MKNGHALLGPVVLRFASVATPVSWGNDTVHVPKLGKHADHVRETDRVAVDEDRNYPRPIICSLNGEANVPRALERRNALMADERLLHEADVRVRNVPVDLLIRRHCESSL